MKKTDPVAPEIAACRLWSAPGHLIRRAQQRAVDLFAAEVGEDGPTPRQYAVLLSVHEHPGINQTDLVRLTGIDRSTLTEILRRMAAKRWLRRDRQAGDRRTNRLRILPEGETVLKAAFAPVERAQERILAPIPPADRPGVLRALARLAAIEGGRPADPQAPRPPPNSG